MLIILSLFSNLISASKHYRFTTSVYGDEYYNYANDLMERSPIYTSNIFKKNKIWKIERNVYKNLEFQNWELKLYLNAKNIKQIDLIRNKKCHLNNNKIIKSFKLNILKGDSVSGYSSFNKEIKVIKNNKISNHIFLYECDEYYIIE